VEQEIIERILAKYSQGQYEDEIKQARDKYFVDLQDLRDDDPSFETLTSCFLSWYVVERPMNNGLGTPLQQYVVDNNDLADDERSMASSMAANIHSLFEITRLDDGIVCLKDLFTSEAIKVSERRRTVGLNRGDIIEARLLPVSDKIVFSSGAFLLHPRESYQLVRNAIDMARVTGKPTAKEIIQRLKALSFRYNDRYRRSIPVEKVYSELNAQSSK
jgi:hypothetical protein